MTCAYHPLRGKDNRLSPGGYRVQHPDGTPVRPTKLAAGMSYTWERSKAARRKRGLEPHHKPITDSTYAAVLHLRVKGTTVDMRTMLYVVERTPCHCCGAKSGGKLRLNNQGQIRLRAARRRKERRGA